MVESAREVCGSVRVEEKNLKSVQWNDEIKAVVRGNKAAWRWVLAADNEGKRKTYESVKRREEKG